MAVSCSTPTTRSALLPSRYLVSTNTYTGPRRKVCRFGLHLSTSQVDARVQAGSSNVADEAGIHGWLR